ncbi:unnamed protein product [Protopolystoma xenopodis]|uniref:Uncharacterized protein n=1 Tax=Protopolystoma xenopodis TaxID=117903 RepID=A0A3S5A8S7_9PLAT|nr:unnamed protein product [Protopolystoma xenopodis]
MSAVGADSEFITIGQSQPNREELPDKVSAPMSAKHTSQVDDQSWLHALGLVHNKYEIKQNDFQTKVADLQKRKAEITDRGKEKLNIVSNKVHYGLGTNEEVNLVERKDDRLRLQYEDEEEIQGDDDQEDDEEREEDEEDDPCEAGSMSSCPLSVYQSSLCFDNNSITDQAVASPDQGSLQEQSSLKQKEIAVTEEDPNLGTRVQPMKYRGSMVGAYRRAMSESRQFNHKKQNIQMEESLASSNSAMDSKKGQRNRTAFTLKQLKLLEQGKFAYTRPTKLI